MNHLLLVDDHPILRQGLAQLLAQMDGIGSVSQADSGAAALQEFRRKKPDGVILDLSLGDESGMDVLRQLRQCDDSVPVMFLTMHDEALHAERALSAGVRGYVMKHEATETIVDGVRRLLAGELVFSRRLQDKVLLNLARRGPQRHATGVTALSPREIEVLNLIGAGHSTTQIASRLSRSIKTIEAHRASLRNKLGLASSFELVRFAMNWIGK